MLDCEERIERIRDKQAELDKLILKNHNRIQENTYHIRELKSREKALTAELDELIEEVSTKADGLDLSKLIKQLTSIKYLLIGAGVVYTVTNGENILTVLIGLL